MKFKLILCLFAFFFCYSPTGLNAQTVNCIWQLSNPRFPGPETCRAASLCPGGFNPCSGLSQANCNGPQSCPAAPTSTPAPIPTTRQSPSSCTSITDPTTCDYNPNCVWNNGCARTCSSISNPDECAYSLGCNWNGSTCTGTAQPPSYAQTQGAGAFSQYIPDFLSAIGINSNLTTIPGILNALLPYIMVIAGLILFIMLLSGGFQLLTSAANPKAADAGKQRLTTAVIGFLIIVVAYWVTQIVEIVLGINILK